jgi:hypothetical protein
VLSRCAKVYGVVTVWDGMQSRVADETKLKLK